MLTICPRPLAHRGNDEPRQDHRRGQIDLQYPGNIFHPTLIELQRLVIARIVHEDVDAPEFRERCIDQRLQRCRIGDVGRHAEHVAARLAQIGRDLLQCVHRACRQHQPRAFRGERLRNINAQAARRARHDGNIVFADLHGGPLKCSGSSPYRYATA